MDFNQAKLERRSGGGYTPFSVAGFIGRGAKIEAFNQGYMKVSMPFPRADAGALSKMDGFNRFFAEGQPDFKPGFLVPFDVVQKAINLHAANKAIEGVLVDDGWIIGPSESNDLSKGVPAIKLFEGRKTVYLNVFVNSDLSYIASGELNIDGTNILQDIPGATGMIDMKDGILDLSGIQSYLTAIGEICVGSRDQKPHPRM